MSTEPSPTVLDQPAALPSDASTSKEGGGVEAHQPSSSSPSSSATIAKPSLPFPFNRPNDLHLFFDPTSARAVGVSGKLQTICQRFKKPSPITLNLDEATHIVLEAATEHNEDLREGVGAHHLVSLQWIINSTFSRKPLDEKDFLVESSRGGLEVVAEDVREEEDESMEEEEEGGESSRLPIVIRKTVATWAEEEEENLARFLATRSAPYRHTDFVHYGRKHHRRTDDAYERRYRARREWFDKRIHEIKAASGTVSAYIEHDSDQETSKTPEREPRRRPTTVQYVEDSDDDSDQNETLKSWRRRKPQGAPLDRGVSPNFRTYSEKEQTTLVRLLSDGNAKLTRVFAGFSKIHSKRSPAAITQHYYTYRAHYDRLSGRGRPAQDQDSESSSDSSSSSDVEEVSDEGAGPVHRHTQRPRPSNASKQPHLPLPQQNWTFSNGSSTIASSSRSPFDLKRPSSFVEPGSWSKRSRVASNVPSSGAPSSSHHSHHQQYASSSSQSHPDAIPSAPSPSSSSSSSRDGQPLEPPSFLELGAKPSSCSQSDQWCYFCGSHGRVHFELLQLVTRNDGGEETAKSIDSRLGCDACARVYRRRLEAKEVAALGMMEKIEYASECVMKEGLEIRREAVEG